MALGVLVGGVGFTVVTVQDADRDPGAPTWKFPRTVADDEEAQGEASGLRGLLLPYEDDLYMPGPDLAEFGSDVELSGRQATALRKESIKDLPRSARREMEKEIDKQRITGMVMRSYLYAEPFAVSDDKTFTVSVVLSQMENRNAVRGISTSQNDVFAALDIFREGPKIKGHKNARCFLTPEVEESGIDRMICSAYQGDVLVNATASGIGPLDSKAVATFLADQLDRIDTPGEAV
ncbi:hypothetical protein StrepF001_13750 [Streptomyces sp. F001]|nr:hypothetical protein StrepF001_13750 [Streptomyces sp. F001]